MGVIRCDKNGCTSLLAENCVNGEYYICPECKEEFKRWIPTQEPAYLDSKQFTEQKEFSAKSYTYSKKTYNKKSYNKRTNWYSNESYYDEDKEEFDLEMFRYHHFSSKKPTTTKYSVNNYEKCDFCGEYYRDDSYVKAGVTKHDKNFCAYCWEEEQDTVKQTHEISDETLEEVIKFKQEQNYFEGINYFSLTESEFSELDRENQVEFIFCSECKRYFHESLDYVEYDTSKNVYKCKSCLAKDKLEGGDKNKVQVV